MFNWQHIYYAWWTCFFNIQSSFLYAPTVFFFSPLYSYEPCFIHGLLKKHEKKVHRLFNFTFRYIYYVFSLTTYPWYIEPPVHGISQHLPMVFWPPYPWYFDPYINGISNPLPMVFWPPYPWYFDPLPMIYQTPYAWYIETPIHGISKPHPMVFWHPYPWYIENHIHGMSSQLSMVYRTPCLW